MTETQRVAMHKALNFIREIDADDRNRDYLSSSQFNELSDCEYALTAALAEPVQEPVDSFKNACRLTTSFAIGRYLMSNAHGRWNGAEKALRHIELCKFYVAAVRGFDDAEKVELSSEDFEAVHDLTKQLTDQLDEVIGFPLDSAPDYAKLEPLFFEHFHALAMQALKVSQQPAPQAHQPRKALKLSDENIQWAWNDACNNQGRKEPNFMFNFARAIESAVFTKNGLSE